MKSRVLGDGSSARLTTRPKKGARYTLWCVVSDHASERTRDSFGAP